MKIYLYQPAKEAIERIMRQWPEGIETGGSLYGYCDDKGQTITVFLMC